MRTSIRLGCAGGYLEGRLDPGIELARHGDCDYLGLEALNEASLSVLQRQLENDPNAGFHSKGVAKAARVLEASASARLVSSVGGANPVAGARALVQMLSDRDHTASVAAVWGENLTERLPELVRSGKLRSDSGATLAPADIANTFAASAYLGAEPIAAALELGVDAVVTGRVVDSALYLGPALHEFGWTSADLDLLATASLGGHLLECAGHLTGGNYWGPGWSTIDYTRIGHGLMDLGHDGSLTVGKLPTASGLVDRHTVTQQLLYEISDPSAYLLPDVTLDFTGVELADHGDDRVTVTGARGHAAPTTHKVLLSRRAGFVAEGTVTFAWPEPEKKATRFATSITSRLREVHGIDEIQVDLLGTGRLGSASGAFSPGEVVLRIAVGAPDAEQAGLLHLELANAYDCGPSGACGIVGPTSGSAAGVRERIDISAAYLDADEVVPQVAVIEA